YSAYRNLRYNQLTDFGAQKYIFTCPNIYTKSHKTNLLKILADVFAEPTHGIYKENIKLVSESDAVLYYYIKKTSGQDDAQAKETVVIIDIGASTMDFTLAGIHRKKENDTMIEDEVIIKNNDGTVLAGETLDKAIAYQVHDILKKYNEGTANELDVEMSGNPGQEGVPGAAAAVTPAQDSMV
ncbi:MAG: hypothetical protein GY757_50000, partial [bacterium]|nr:hypothetical protein [bacterium]